MLWSSQRLSKLRYTSNPSILPGLQTALSKRCNFWELANGKGNSSCVLVLRPLQSFAVVQGRGQGSFGLRQHRRPFVVLSFH